MAKWGGWVTAKDPVPDGGKLSLINGMATAPQPIPAGMAGIGSTSGMVTRVTTADDPVPDGTKSTKGMSDRTP